jgi:hypothetical protein
VADKFHPVIEVEKISSTRRTAAALLTHRAHTNRIEQRANNFKRELVR